MVPVDAGTKMCSSRRRPKINLIAQFISPWRLALSSLVTSWYRRQQSSNKGKMSVETNLMRSSKNNEFLWNFSLCRVKWTLFEMEKIWSRHDISDLIKLPRIWAWVTKGIAIPLISIRESSSILINKRLATKYRNLRLGDVECKLIRIGEFRNDNLHHVQSVVARDLIGWQDI